MVTILSRSQALYGYRRRKEGKDLRNMSFDPGSPICTLRVVTPTLFACADVVSPLPLSLKKSAGNEQEPFVYTQGY